MVPLIITYIWFGVTIPEEYLIRLSNANYPVQILINPPENQNLNKNTYDIQKADLYRLQYLKNGGIYSDFDNIINYTCLMKQIEDFDGQMMLMDFNYQGKLPNSFIYVPFHRTELVKEILQKQTKKQCEKQIVTCYGPQMYWKYRSRITVKSLYHCIDHTFDWSWWKQSNDALGRSTKPSKFISSSQITKQQYVQMAVSYQKQRNLLLVFCAILGVTIFILLTKFYRANKIFKKQIQQSEQTIQIIESVKN